MRRIVPVLLLLPAAAISVFWWRAEDARRAAEQRMASLEKEVAQLKAEALSVPAPAQSEEDAPDTQQPKMAPVPAGTDPAPYLRTIEELREQARELSREISTARDAAAAAEARLTDASAEIAKGKAEAAELREDLQAAKRLAAAVQAELTAKNDRIVRVETNERLMQERLSRAEATVAKAAAAGKEIEDLNRRREASITTLVRRIREVSDLYRNFTLNAQTHETPATGGLQAGDLSRIQSAIQQAEDDLRQLQTLNARAAQLARAK